MREGHWLVSDQYWYRMFSPGYGGHCDVTFHIRASFRLQHYKTNLEVVRSYWIGYRLEDR